MADSIKTLFHKGAANYYSTKASRSFKTAMKHGENERQYQKRMSYATKAVEHRRGAS